MWERSNPDNAALRVLVTVALIVDTPLSLVADTLVLPFDLVLAPKRPRVDPGDCDSVGIPSR